MTQSVSLPQGVEITETTRSAWDKVLSPKALGFIAKLARKFETRRNELLAARYWRQSEFDGGALPDFLPQTRHVRESE